MQLKPNESTADRVIRIVVGLVLAAVALGGAVAAPWIYVTLLVAAIALLTGATGFCPLYAVLHVRTNSMAR